MELGRVRKNSFGSYDMYVLDIEPKSLHEIEFLNPFTEVTWVDFKYGPSGEEPPTYRLVFVSEFADGSYATIIGDNGAERLNDIQKEVIRTTGGNFLGEEPRRPRKYKSWRCAGDNPIKRKIMLPDKPDIIRISDYIEKKFNGFSDVKVPLASFVRVPEPVYDSFCAKFAKTPLPNVYKQAMTNNK